MTALYPAIVHNVWYASVMNVTTQCYSIQSDKVAGSVGCSSAYHMTHTGSLLTCKHILLGGALIIATSVASIKHDNSHGKTDCFGEKYLAHHELESAVVMYHYYY